VLVLRALGIGDLLVAVPALRGLRHAFPDHRIVLAAPEKLAELVALTGAVDELLPTPGLGALRWSYPPGLAVNLHGAGPESIVDLLATRPDTLITHRHPMFPDVAGPPWQDSVHEVRRWCDLLAWHGIHTDPDDLGLLRPDLPSPAPGAIVVHPGAGFGSRRWPADRYAEVARQLTRCGRRVVVSGGHDERALAQTVARQAGLPADAVLAGRLGLGDLAALIADAELVISNDTGVGHLATAYGTPSVLLFGPTSPAGWGPPTDRPQHMVLWAGETGDPFSDTVFPGLLRLSIEDVLAAADTVDQRRGRPVG
jgi:ADP-heptose:LPS heptosyltransferase